MTKDNFDSTYDPTDGELEATKFPEDEFPDPIQDPDIELPGDDEDTQDDVGEGELG